MALHYRTRTDLDSLPSYKAGKTPEVNPHLKTYKLSSNESPFEPLPEVLEALSKKSNYNLYPEPFAASLRTKIAELHGVQESQVLTSGGGLSIIYQVCDALVQKPTDEIIYPWRSFEAYPIATQIAGAVNVPVPLLNNEHDLLAMQAAITEKTKLIILCSPNNPTGTCISKQAFENFMKNVPQDLPVLLDEAYFEFVTDKESVQGNEYLDKFPNLITLRTFSKAYGLAGLRIGYAITSTDLAQFLDKLSRPFEVSAAALDAAKISLDYRDKALARVDEITAERDRVHTALKDYLNESIMPKSQGNFIWFNVTKDSDSFTETLLLHGITARPYGTQEGVRVTISDPEANDVLIKAVKNFTQHSQHKNKTTT
ncbi:MAG: histidinol-phosphate transaminase [Micrococcaceae bacterium]